LVVEVLGVLPAVVDAVLELLLARQLFRNFLRADLCRPLLVACLEQASGVLALALTAGVLVELVVAATAVPPISSAEQASAEINFIVILLNLPGLHHAARGVKSRACWITAGLSAHYEFVMRLDWPSGFGRALSVTLAASAPPQIH
jgi:hypothetical protein